MTKNVVTIILFIILFIFILCIIYNNNLNQIEHYTLVKNINKLNKDKIHILKNRINTIIDTNINSIELNNISKIINIYQEKYINSNCPGIGDFIRGSYFIIQFSKKFNIKYEIIINHPISNYLKNKYIIDNNILNNINFVQTIIDIRASNNTNNLIIYEYIEEYNKNKVNDIIDTFKNCFKRDYYINKNNIIYFSTNQYPIYKIKDDEKSIIRNIFEPNNIMNNYININLDKLKLSKKNYIVIHFRTGDDYLIHKNIMSFDKFKLIINEINKIKSIEKNIPIVIISDNQMLKIYLKKNVKDINILDNKITHLGENQSLNDDNVKDTLLDFYITNNSKKVFSFTKYSHGSGFIQWNCITFNVPYVIKYISDL
jgi:hypothetical protein